MQRSSRWDPGPLMQDVSALLRLHTELKGEIHELLVGQRELLRHLAQGQSTSSGGLLGAMTTVFTSGSLIPQASTSDVANVKEDASEQPLQSEAVADSNGVPRQGPQSGISFGGVEVVPDEDGSIAGESFVEIDPDGMHGGDGTGSEANSAAWPSGQGDWRIGVSLSPFWPSTIKRQDGFAVNDALLFSTHSIGLNAAMRNRSSQALHIQANTSQHYWTLHPGGNTRLIMDVIGAVVLFFDLWIVPFVLSWNLKDKWVNDLAAVSILYWLIDLLLNFFTGYHRYGEVEMGLLKSMKHYLLTMFTPDAVVLVADMVATMAEIRE
eukprot:3465592-Amphidinium_carterae.1